MIRIVDLSRVTVILPALDEAAALPTALASFPPEAGLLVVDNGSTDRTAEVARAALDLGFYISFSGIVAFPRSEVIQAVAKEVPRDRLLVETDAPFLAPPPYRGRRNEPAFVVEVARKVAALRGTSLDDVGAAAGENYARLFRR